MDIVHIKLKRFVEITINMLNIDDRPLTCEEYYYICELLCKINYDNLFTENDLNNIEEWYELREARIQKKLKARKYRNI